MTINHVAEIAGGMLASGAAAYAAVVQVGEQSPAGVSPFILQWWPVLVMAGVGLIMWGELRTRVKTLEQEMRKHELIPERLAVIETKLDLLITTGTHHNRNGSP
jgi:hypothetical protein